jgi:LysR family transcriptional regulator, hydrogen peroxide-inducible genes activator
LVVDELSGVRQEASRFLCLEDAHVKVGIMCTIGPRRFTGLLTDFNMRHRGIQLQLVPSRLSELVREDAQRWQQRGAFR